MSKRKNKCKNSLSKIKNILLKGPVLTNSGYGVHCRQVFSALKSRNDINLIVQPTNWGNNSWILNDNSRFSLIDDILKCCKKEKNVTYHETYQVALPNEWEVIGKINIGITAGFESNKVKKTWIENCNLMDNVIVPSEYSKQAFLNTSKENKIELKTNIEVIGEYFYPEFEAKDLKDYNYLKTLKYDKNILVLSQLTNIDEEKDRKNLFKTIRTISKFIENKDIGLVLKVNVGKYTNKSFKFIKNIFAKKIKKNVLEKVCILFGDLCIEELHYLYTHPKISCFVSGTRGEGFGLPFLESAACGLPIIATNNSAYKEFLGEDFLKVDFDKELISKNSNFVDIDSDASWSDFKESSMINCLRDFFKNEKDFNELSIKRQKIIKQKYNMNTIHSNYKTFFERISI